MIRDDLRREWEVADPVHAISRALLDHVIASQCNRESLFREQTLPSMTFWYGRYTKRCHGNTHWMPVYRCACVCVHVWVCGKLLGVFAWVLILLFQTLQLCIFFSEHTSPNPALISSPPLHCHPACLHAICLNSSHTPFYYLFQSCQKQNKSPPLTHSSTELQTTWGSKHQAMFLKSESLTFTRQLSTLVMLKGTTLSLWIKEVPE